MHVGLLTGGGDCPGLNAVIRAVVRKISNEGGRCTGFLEGSFLSLLLNLEQRAALLLRPYADFDRTETSATCSIEMRGDLDQKKEEVIEQVMMEFKNTFHQWREKPKKSRLLLYLRRGGNIQ